MWMCFAFDWKDDTVRLFGLTAEYPTTLKQSLKQVDKQILGHYVSAYPQIQLMSTRIHLTNIFKIIFTVYPHIHISTSIYTQRKKHTVCLFVVLKAAECRKAHQDSCVSTYPALSGLQLRNGRVFCSYFDLFGSKFCKKCERS